jgi:WD40 repeat protein
MAFSPKGDLLAVSIDFESKMFVVDSELRQIAEIDNGGAVFGPDGKSLAVVTSDSGLKLFDTSTWELKDSLPSRLGPVQQIVFRRDKQVLVSSHEGSVTVGWNMQIGAEVSRISSPGKHFLSPDGKFLAIGTESGDVSVWNVDTGELLKSYQHVSQHGVSNITFSQENHLLIISYPDQAWNVVFWEWETNQEPRIISLDEGLAYIGAVSPDGRKLAIQTWKNEISSHVGVWDTETRELDWISKNSDAAWISSVALHPNGGILAVGDRWIGTISLYDTNSGALLETLNEPDRLPDYDIPVENIIFSHDGRHMAAIINGGPVNWDLESYAVINVERGCIRPIKSVAFSQDDTLFMIAGEKNLYTDTQGGGVCIWETQTGKLLASVGPADAYTSNFATFNPERTILAMDDNGTIWLWGSFR